MANKENTLISELIKEDYSIEKVPEAIYAKTFKTVPLVDGFSTTTINSHIKN